MWVMLGRRGPSVQRSSGHELVTVRLEWVSEGFRLKKGIGRAQAVAVCEIWQRPTGWQVRLVVDGHGLYASRAVASSQEMTDVVVHWRAKLLAEGWRPAQSE
jgi:hypothetical protein